MRHWIEIRIGRQPGQAIVLVVFMIMALFAGVGIAIDAGSGYYTNTLCERAAAAAALSGVVFMPYNFTTPSPAGSRNDASDRAVDEAKRNGLDAATQAGTVVTPAAVPGASNKLQVTVQKMAPVYFMQVFGIGPYPVSRVAIATYLPPLSLGQPGNVIGSTVSQLGNGGYYFMRTEGWNVARDQGDGFTPNPSLGGCGACPTNDVHQISATNGVDTADPSLPDRGGYNYKIVVPAGSTARVQVYNAAFAPEFGTHNFCENWKTGFAQRTCSPGSNYYMHEDDSCCVAQGDKTTYSAMEYTLFSAPSVFIRGSDTKLTQMVVKPIDASNFGGTPPTYSNVNTGAPITQTYNAVTGAPTNMLVYHSWIDVATYRGDLTEPTLVSYKPGFGPLGGALGPGTYRLRFDTLNYDGSNPPGNSAAHKGLAVRVTDAGGSSPCAACSLSAMNDMAIFTPVDTSGGAAGVFKLPLFQLPPDYAGRTLGVDLFDVGDMSGSGNIYIGLIDPRTNALANVSPNTVSIWDLGTQRSNYGTGAATLLGTSTIAETLCTTGSTYNCASRWYHFDVPIPGNYNPGANPNNWWWSLQYRTTANVTAADTVTIALYLKGNPAHLLQS